MKIKRNSPFTGTSHEQEIDVTEEQLQDWLGGTLIQNAMPDLTADEREFIQTGITPKEWKEYLEHEGN